MYEMWKPTHRTIGGVEVACRPEGSCVRVFVVNDALSTGAIFSKTEAAALFEPIPRLPTVTIPLETAVVLMDTIFFAHPAGMVLREAIREAENEAATP